jgi:hypothetical protein
MSKKLTEFSLKSIYKVKDLDEQFGEHLRKMTADCLARPAVGQAREIKLTLKLFPDPSDCDNVLVDFVVTTKTPKHDVDRYRMLTSARGDLRFEPNFPLDPMQQGLFDDDDE